MSTGHYGVLGNRHIQALSLQDREVPVGGNQVVVASPHDFYAAPAGVSEASAVPMSRGAVRCWQVMTELAIDNRVDAIDYLHNVEPAVRLSTEALAALLDAFPLLPTAPGRSNHHDARKSQHDSLDRPGKGGR